MRRSIPVLALILSASTAFGWGDLGHETTAEIAEVLLRRNDPGTMQQIQNILGVEPMPIAAIWPDMVRGDDRFAPKYASGPETPEEKKKREEDNLKKLDLYHFFTKFDDPSKKNVKDAMVVLERFPGLLSNKKQTRGGKNYSITREAKIIALRYIIHVAGDVHQPLHIGNEYDRGGNVCLVNVRPKDPTKEKEDINDYANLHSTWDGTVVNDVLKLLSENNPKASKYQQYKWMAPALLAKHPDLLKDTELDPRKWADESNDYLTKGVVYPDTLVAKERPYCNYNKNAIDKKSIPVLDDKYFETAEAIAERRLVLGGVRLANLLSKTFKNYRQRGPQENFVLWEVDLRNTDVLPEPLPQQLEFDFGGDHQ